MRHTVRPLPKVENRDIRLPDGALGGRRDHVIHAEVIEEQRASRAAAGQESQIVSALRRLSAWSLVGVRERTIGHEQIG